MSSRILIWLNYRKASSEKMTMLLSELYFACNITETFYQIFVLYIYIYIHTYVYIYIYIYIIGKITCL